jgi:hypothetical protein
MAIHKWPPTNPTRSSTSTERGLVPISQAVPPPVTRAVQVRPVRDVVPARPRPAPATEPVPVPSTRRVTRLVTSWAVTWLVLVVLCLAVAEHEAPIRSVLAGATVIATLLVAGVDRGTRR